jgi:ribonuclease PH
VTRHDGRAPDELRPLELVPGFLDGAHGSALVSLGRTRVVCTATVEEGVPRWLEGRGSGWLTAEYGMLPASGGADRIRREASAGRQKGRTVEIQRLIGRAIRGGYGLENLGERTVWLDCDVLQADGGTRTAAVTGAWVALALAAREKGFTEPAEPIAAVSLGIVGGDLLLDLDYVEDSSAEVDMNVVMTGGGRLIDIQATAEREPFELQALDGLLSLARSGIDRIAEEQLRAVGRA